VEVVVESSSVEVSAYINGRDWRVVVVVACVVFWGKWRMGMGMDGDGRIWGVYAWVLVLV
jgi:hypothetical protein